MDELQQVEEKKLDIIALVTPAHVTIGDAELALGDLSRVVSTEESNV